MANIVTEKKVLLLNEANPSNINLQPQPGAFIISVKNEGVIHNIQLSPDEAIQMGVALIQGANVAVSMAQHIMAAKAANGIAIPKP